MRDPINFGFDYYGDSLRIALKILRINSTDLGYNKYQGILKYPNDTELLKCNFNLFPYGQGWYYI